MKFLVVLAAVVACAAAASVESVPQYVYKGDDYQAPIVRSSFDSSPEGYNFQHGYETGNGISAYAEGVLKNPTSENAALEVKGSYKYTAPDGTPVEITYIADENGYQASGNAIPVAPPIPESILRSLAYIEAHPPPVVQPATVVKKY